MNDEERYADYLESGARDAMLDAAAADELDVLRALLASPSTWDDPPPELAGDIIAAIRAAPAVEQLPSRRRSTPRTVFAAAAAVVLAAAVGAVLLTRGDSSGERFALAATEVIPGASGSATVEATGTGLAISLTVDGLPPAEPGTFYQAWMRGDDGSVPIGTFHAREDRGPIDLWSGVEVADYPLLTVTIQQERAGPESSGIVVLRGEIPEP